MFCVKFHFETKFRSWNAKICSLSHQNLFNALQQNPSHFHELTEFLIKFGEIWVTICLLLQCENSEESWHLKHSWAHEDVYIHIVSGVLDQQKNPSDAY